MKIRKDVRIDILENYGYHYELNLAFPTYKKVKEYGSGYIVIEIVIMNREIFINKSKCITKKNILFINDLIRNNLIEK